MCPNTALWWIKRVCKCVFSKCVSVLGPHDYLAYVAL